MSTQIVNLEAEIISALKNIPATIPPKKGYGVWTAAIKRTLITLGKAKGYNVCASGFPGECDREWLFDLVWYRYDSQEFLREVGLALESEWSRDPIDIKYDFEKLLVAKSPIKIMVFQDYKENLPAMWSLLETSIRSFKTEPADEKYILVAFEESKYAFEVRTVTA